MEFIAELVIEILLELVTNKNIPKWIKYPITAFLSFVYITLIVFLGIFAIKLLAINNKLAEGITILGIDLLLIYMGIKLMKKISN